MSGDEARLGYEYLAALKESDLSTYPQIQIGAAGNDASLLCSRWGMNMLCPFHVQTLRQKLDVCFFLSRFRSGLGLGGYKSFMRWNMVLSLSYRQQSHGIRIGTAKRSCSSLLFKLGQGSVMVVFPLQSTKRTAHVPLHILGSML
jgi:hypothetical protein